MNVRIHASRDSARGLAYLVAPRSVETTVPMPPRLTAIRSLGLGLHGADAGWQTEDSSRARTFEVANAVIATLSAHRPDLKNRVVHIVLSADPAWMSTKSLSQTRRAYDDVLSHVLAEIGLHDRAGVAVLHADGHTAWRSREFLEPAKITEHLHAVMALPQPESLRSIPLHRLQSRTREACRQAWRLVGLPSTSEEADRASAVAPIRDTHLDEVLRSIARKERERSRQPRVRGLER